MEHPFPNELRLPLEVDAKIGHSWYECKWIILTIIFNIKNENSH